jgi:hypothetical protein
LPTLLTIANREGWHIPSDLVAAQVAQRSISHRAVRIVFTARNDSSAPLNATALRFGIGRALGWNRVRSDSYELGLRNGALVFDGTGHGHGVGLCQAGAAEMASEGRSANYILAFYFPGTAVRITAEDHGWQEARTDALSIRSTQTVTARQQSSFLQLWSEAQRRFPPVHPIAPMIIFAPTTELFRQLTTPRELPSCCNPRPYFTLQQAPSRRRCCTNFSTSPLKQPAQPARHCGCAKVWWSCYPVSRSPRRTCYPRSRSRLRCNTLHRFSKASALTKQQQRR